MPASSNTGKWVAANTLVRAVQSFFRGLRVRVLMDSGYMRQYVISTMLNRGFHVIDQVRRDTRLYDLPAPRLESQRGRSRRYGEKLTPEQAEQLPRCMAPLHIYDKEQRVRLRSILAKVRFLNGRLVRVVWCEFENDHKPGQWKTASLLLSTDTTLTSEQIVESYSLRWSIEPMFNQLKQAWGMKEAWQQTRQTLHRWVHITMAGLRLGTAIEWLEQPGSGGTVSAFPMAQASASNCRADS